MSVASCNVGHMNSDTATITRPSNKSLDFYDLLLTIMNEEDAKVTSLHAKDAAGVNMDIRASRLVGQALTEVLRTTDGAEEAITAIQGLYPGITISQVQATSVSENVVISLHINGTYQARPLKAA